jgi:Uma2 family endonuclease
MAAKVVRRLFTVEEYYKMAKAGILHKYDRVELIEGEIVKAGIVQKDDRVELIEEEIVEVSAIGSRHAGCVKHLNWTFSDKFRGRVVIGVQDPVRLGGHTEPEPDITLLIPRPDYYRNAHPMPEEVLLLIEVADTSQDYDRDVKAPLYARYGIAEYWLIDLEEERIEVYRSPSPEGYQEVRIVERGESLYLQAFPDMALTVDEIMGNDVMGGVMGNEVVG